MLQVGEESLLHEPKLAIPSLLLMAESYALKKKTLKTELYFKGMLQKLTTQPQV